MAGLQGNVKVPGLGDVKKKYVAIGLTITGVAIGLYYYKKRKSPSTPAGTPATSVGTDPAGNVGVIDPSTGYVEGTPEDLAALAAMNPNQPGTPGGGGGSSGPPSGTTGPPFSDNATWTQYAIQQLVDVQNMDGATVGQILGKYIQGQPVTATERITIDDAIGVAGKPPVAGPNGRPPAINLIGGGSPPSSTPGAPTGLKQLYKQARWIEAGWNSVSGAQSYQASIREAVTGHYLINKRITGTRIGATAKPSTAYIVDVWANGTTGHGPTASITISTSK